MWSDYDYALCLFAPGRRACQAIRSCAGVAHTHRHGYDADIDALALTPRPGPSSVFATVKYDNAESALQAATALNGRILPATSAYYEPCTCIS